MPLGFDIDRDRLAEVCRRYHVVTLDLFGSRARGEAGPDSDVDLLVTFEDGHTPGLAFVTLADELEACFGHQVDLLTRASIERSSNPIRRQHILERTEAVYAAA